MPDDQFRFIRGRSAELQLIRAVVERWHKAMNQRHRVHAVFLDAVKALDRVDHWLLLQSFYALGVQGFPQQWLPRQNYLSDRLIQVRMMDTLSTATITSGVSQGAVLGPSLFLVHFRRIPEAMSPSQTSPVRRHNGVPGELFWKADLALL